MQFQLSMNNWSENRKDVLYQIMFYTRQSAVHPLFAFAGPMESRLEIIYNGLHNNWGLSRKKLRK